MQFHIKTYYNIELFFFSVQWFRFVLSRMGKAVHLLNLYFPHRTDSSKPLQCKVSLGCWCPGSVQTRNQKGKAKKKAAKKEESLMPPSKTYTTHQSKTMLNFLQIYNTCCWCRKKVLLWMLSGRSALHCCNLFQCQERGNILQCCGAPIAPSNKLPDAELSCIHCAEKPAKALSKCLSNADNFNLRQHSCAK